MTFTRPAFTILDAIGIKTDSFVGSATTNLLTSDNAHGLKVGDMIVLTEDNTLPTPLAEATVYYVARVPSTTTFAISLGVGQDEIVLTSTTTSKDTYTMHDIGRTLNCSNERNIILAINTDGGGDAALTAKIQGSVSDDCPDFSAAQTASNQWDYVECIDLSDGNSVAGGDGFVVATADDHVQYEVNTNRLKWLNIIISGWSEGEVTVKAFVADNQ